MTKTERSLQKAGGVYGDYRSKRRASTPTEAQMRQEAWRFILQASRVSSETQTGTLSPAIERKGK